MNTACKAAVQRDLQSCQDAFPIFQDVTCLDDTRDCAPELHSSSVHLMFSLCRNMRSDQACTDRLESLLEVKALDRVCQPCWIVRSGLLAAPALAVKRQLAFFAEQ